VAFNASAACIAASVEEGCMRATLGEALKVTSEAVSAIRLPDPWGN
jgi:hypothetical protein